MFLMTTVHHQLKGNKKNVAPNDGAIPSNLIFIRSSSERNTQVESGGRKESIADMYPCLDKPVALLVNKPQSRGHFPTPTQS